MRFNSAKGKQLCINRSFTNRKGTHFNSISILFGIFKLFFEAQSAGGFGDFSLVIMTFVHKLPLPRRNMFSPGWLVSRIYS